ncbi:hypothetical protein RA27_21555 [Ruegeria sp. ANG-R]|nr:hypothetical protein RA27_21555 [Ruegeria sp. ANG-R]
MIATAGADALACAKVLIAAGPITQGSGKPLVNTGPADHMRRDRMAECDEKGLSLQLARKGQP